MSATQKLLRFGIFELNLDTEELRKDGIPVKLPPQPFRVLALLARQAGQVIPREEIRQQIWGEETYVDFEHGLNQCVKQIRTALADNADRPLYVETIPRRGYRFLAQVTSKTTPAPVPNVVESPSSIRPSLGSGPVPTSSASGSALPASASVAGPHAAVAAVPAQSQVSDAEPAVPMVAVMPSPEERQSTNGISLVAPPTAPSETELDEAKPAHSRLRVLILAVCLLALVGTASWYWLARSAQGLTAKDTVLLADFNNQTGDPALDVAMNTALAVALQQSPYLNMLSPDKVRRTLKAMNYSEVGPLTAALARDVCGRTHSKAVVSGAIADAGNHYRIDLQAQDCQRGEPLAQAGSEAASRSEIINALGLAVVELRRKLGEPTASLKRFNKPLGEATSSSIEALQAYADGAKEKRQHGDVPPTFAYFSRAVELDSNFAQPYLSLGIGYLNSHQVDLSVKNLTKAYELRHRVTERDRLAIETFYYMGVTGETDKTIQTFTDWAKTYPNDFIAHADLSEFLMAVGQYEKAAAEAREAVRLRPAAFAYVNLMSSYIRINRLEEAKGVFDEALTFNLNDGILNLQRYLLAFLQNDEAGMEEQLAGAKGKPAVEHLMLAVHSDTEAYRGRFAKAREFSKQAMESASRAGVPQEATTEKLNEALREAEVGNSAQARQLAAEALTISTERDHQTAAALALARAGDLTQAQELADTLNRDYPLDTLVQNHALPTIRAAIELQKNNPGKAVDILRVALPYELGDLSFRSFPAIYPAYVRGEAYLKEGQGQLAAAEFRKIIEHPGIVGNFITGALAYLQLGRARALMGDKAAARKSYQNFLALWKEADPDIPICKEAKAEYARLQ